MFIKRLEVFGFKSFKERTVLEFEDQDITGVVGPNGCGKSNIVDALLWVMGENSPKNLRGEALSDIIFGGTNKEPAGNLVEVKLTLNSGQTGFPVAYEKFSEIMIIRRSYREGKNEYFINDKECLLRDVREFFMNTGAGCRGFSIIEQESIERLITAKPLQRRYIIEEAAGITKFKNQKAESLRKLQLVDQNLKRLEDVLKIQSNRLAQLNSQAKKVEKYKKLKTEIEMRNKQISVTLFQDLMKEQEAIKQEIEQTETQKTEDQNTLEAKKQEALTQEQEIKDRQRQRENVKQELSQTQIKLASLKDKAKTFEMIEEFEQKNYQLELEIKALREKLIFRKDSFKDDHSFSHVETELLKTKNKIDEIKQSKNSLQVHIDLLTKQVDFVRSEKGSLSDEEDKLREAIKKSINRKNQIKELLKKEKAQKLIVQKAFLEGEQKEQELKVKKEQREKERNQLEARSSALSHKVEELKKLLCQVAKINQSADELIQWKPEQYQLLFEKIDVESEWTKALSVVLGSLAQAIVPDEFIDLEQGIEKLKTAQKGKSWFLSRLNQEEVSSSLREQLRGFPAVLCFLDEKVKWNVSCSPLKNLLQKTVIVSDLKSAFELKKQFPRFQFVTKTGDFITENSMVYAGSDNQESSLLEIRSQIEESLKQLSMDKTQLEAKKIEATNILKQFEEARSQRKTEEEKLSGLVDTIKNSEKELEFLEKDLARLTEMRDKNTSKMKDFEEKHNNLSQHNTLFSEDIKNQEQLIANKSSYLDLLNVTFDKMKSQKALEKEANLLLNLVGSLDGKPLTRESLKTELEKQEKEKQSQEQQLKTLQTLQEKAQSQQTEKESQIRQLEQALFQAELDIKSFQAEEEKKEIEKSHLKTRFYESHQESIEEFKPNDSLLLDKMKEELAGLQEQLERIKEVNFLALEEYESLMKDHEFLVKQKEDLEASGQGIKQVIYHIDKTCKTRFNQMLEETNTRFSRVFPIIFGGDNAKAELVLYEEKGEQGVDIKVHPPGKKPQSISLLSRGEKALTSLCLIYSLFLVKPSPFCIIDEADAPLDDANIFRFLSVLKEMSRKSQIIIITHNKYTMQNCSRLYGVTQKEPGISQVVSVDKASPLFAQT